MMRCMKRSCQAEHLQRSLRILNRYLDLRWLNSLNGLNSKSNEARTVIKGDPKAASYFVRSTRIFFKQFCVIHPIRTDATGSLNSTPSPSLNLRQLHVTQLYLENRAYRNGEKQYESNKALQPTPSRFAGWGCSDPLLAAHLRVGSVTRSGWLSLTLDFYTKFTKTSGG